MSTPAVRKISLDPAALAALEKDGAVKFDKPLPPKVVQIIHKRVMKALFGPSMKPTFKQQLLQYSSFAAIKASWAADYWQNKMTEKYG